MRAFVAAKLADDWSPQQISGHFAKQYPVGSGIRISHEAIHKSLFIQTRGVLKRELQQPFQIASRAARSADVLCLDG